MGATGTAVVEEVKAIVLAGAGELLGEDSPYERGRRALRKEYAQVLVASAEVKKVESAEDAAEATKFGRLLQVGKTETEAYFKGIKVQIDAIKKPVLDAEKVDVGALEDEKKRLGVLLTTYEEKVEKERREAQRIADLAREAEEKKERERLEQEARDAQIERALAAEASGDVQQAEEILEAVTVVDGPIYSMPVVAQSSAPARPSGSIGRTTYTAAVIGWEEKMAEKPETHPGWKNFKLLVEAVAAGKAPLRALLPNESFIATQGRNYKEGFSMPGCKGDKVRATGFRG